MLVYSVSWKTENDRVDFITTTWARNFFGRLLGLKFVRALNNYSKWRRFWTSPVQVTKNLESSRLACTGIPSTTGSPKITKRSPNVERNKYQYFRVKKDGKKKKTPKLVIVCFLFHAGVISCVYETKSFALSIMNTDKTCYLILLFHWIKKKRKT